MNVVLISLFSSTVFSIMMIMNTNTGTKGFTLKTSCRGYNQINIKPALFERGKFKVRQILPEFSITCCFLKLTISL